MARSKQKVAQTCMSLGLALSAADCLLFVTVCCMHVSHDRHVLNLVAGLMDDLEGASLFCLWRANPNACNVLT